MVNRSESTMSSGGGTLAGDVLWLAVLSFIFAIIGGLLG
jgi:hypothetical protein